MAGALEDCLVVAGGLEAVEPKRKVGTRHSTMLPTQDGSGF